VDQDVQVKETRTPSLTGDAPGLCFDALELDEQVEWGKGRIDGDDRIPELGLVEPPPGRCREQPRHGADADARGRLQGADRPGQGGLRIAEVRPKAEVGAAPSNRHGPPATLGRVSDPRVIAIILHPETPAHADHLSQAVGRARADLAEEHRRRFLAAGADEARVVAGPPDALPFGARLRGIAHSLPDGAGLIILGSGAVPLATTADLARFVRIAMTKRALANNRYSADIVAIPDARKQLAELPADLTSDNALPRWLAEIGGLPVDDLPNNWRLAMDFDTALDLVLLGRRWARYLAVEDRARVTERLGRIRTVAADPRAELVVAGRTSPAALTWLARTSASRTRALVEERGLRTSVAGQRPAASVLGLLLERDGPESLGAHLARLGEAAIVDSRVLVAHRLGADQAGWPSDADRFASDMLLHERVTDPWLRALTRAAAEAAIPVTLGAHGLVGPGLRLALRGVGRAIGRRSAG